MQALLSNDVLFRSLRSLRYTSRYSLPSSASSYKHYYYAIFSSSLFIIYTQAEAVLKYIQEFALVSMRDITGFNFERLPFTVSLCLSPYVLPPSSPSLIYSLLFYPFSLWYLRLALKNLFREDELVRKQRHDRIRELEIAKQQLQEEGERKKKESIERRAHYQSLLGDVERILPQIFFWPSLMCFRAGECYSAAEPRRRSHPIGGNGKRTTRAGTC